MTAAAVNPGYGLLNDHRDGPMDDHRDGGGGGGQERQGTEDPAGLTQSTYVKTLEAFRYGWNTLTASGHL